MGSKTFSFLRTHFSRTCDFLHSSDGNNFSSSIFDISKNIWQSGGLSTVNLAQHTACGVARKQRGYDLRRTRTNISNVSHVKVEEARLKH